MIRSDEYLKRGRMDISFSISKKGKNQVNLKASITLIAFVIFALIVLPLLLDGTITSRVVEEPKDIEPTILPILEVTRARPTTDFPRVAQGGETRFFNHKYSNTSGVLMTAHPSITCDWGHPNSAWKKCVTVFSIENKNINLGNISLPNMTFLFQSNTTQNVKTSFSDDSSLVNHIAINRTLVNQRFRKNNYTYTVREFINYRAIPSTINTSDPFSIKIEYEDLKYSGNQFNFTLSSGGFSAKIDPDQSACGNLTVNTAPYRLTQNVNSSGTCFTFGNSSVILDCQGYNITYGTNGLSGAYGFDVTHSEQNDNITIRNCVITEGFTSAVEGVNRNGIRFDLSDNITIRNNSFTTRGLGSNAIVTLSSGEDARIINNTIYANNHSTIWGIVIENSQRALIENNTINITSSTSGSAIEFNINPNDGVARGNTISATNRGIYFSLDGNNFLIDGNRITSVSFDAVVIDNAFTGITFLNNNITSPLGNSEIVDNTPLTSINQLVYNNTFGEARWTNNSFLGELVIATVSPDLGLGRNIFLENRTYTFNHTTITSGIMNRTGVNITMFGLNFSNVTNILRVDYFDRDYGNITQSPLAYDCARNNGCQIFSYSNVTRTLVFNITNSSGSFAPNGTYAGEASASLVFVDSTRQNGSFTSRTDFILLNVTLVDPTPGINTWNLTIANRTTVNRTTFTSTNKTFTFNFTVGGLGDGIYSYNATVLTLESKVNSTETRVITLDSTNPTISFTSPTETNNTFINAATIFVNVTAVDTNEANITFTLGNNTLVNSTTYVTSVRNYTFTALHLNSQYSYNSTIIDNISNQNTTQTRVITLDNIFPTRSITSSAGTTFVEGTTTALTCDTVDTNPSSMNMKQGSTTLCTGTSSCSASLTPSTGTSTITCEATDKASNSASTTQTLTVTKKSEKDGSSGLSGGTAPSLATKLVSEGEQTFTLSDAEVGVQSVSFIPKIPIFGATISILPQAEPKLSKKPRHQVYKFFEVNTKNFENKDLESARISFTVSKEWLDEQKKESEDVVLLRLEKDLWKEYPSQLTKVEGKVFYYKSEVPGFSMFAIAVKTRKESFIEVEFIKEQIQKKRVEGIFTRSEKQNLKRGTVLIAFFILIRQNISLRNKLKQKLYFKSVIRKRASK